jgi:hypothetical protein
VRDVRGCAFYRYRRYPRSPGVVRGHSLTIDSGWQEVAELALKFVMGCV